MTMEMTVGLMFDHKLEKVALIRKSKGPFEGLLNGPGGKIENGECGVDCIVREFKEEVDGDTEPGQWNYFAIMTGYEPSYWSVEFFTTKGDITKLKAMEDEELVIINVADIFPGRKDCVPNLPFLIAAAHSKLKFGGPKFLNIKD